MSLVMADANWLPVECWCHARIVGVTQRDVANCRTASCGGLFCESPDGDATVGRATTSGFRVLDRPADATDRPDRPARTPCRLRPADQRPDPALRRPAYRLPERPRETTTAERVRILYESGFSPALIAERLGLRLDEVSDDIIACMERA